MADRAVEGARAMRTADRAAIVAAFARGLRARADEIRRANDEDLADARVSAAKLDRLRIDVEATARGVEAVAALPDPPDEERVVPSGLRVVRRRVPIGVILMIYESRPNVTADAAALCLRAGNAVILKGGAEARRTNRAIVESIDAPPGAVQLVETHADVEALLAMSDRIDLVIPRGGEALIRAVAERSRIPVLKHFRGNCHVYVDAAADLTMAERIVADAKMQRPATCNAAEHLLVHRDVAAEFLPRVAARLRGVELRGDATARAILPGIGVEEDWDAEYLDLVLGVRVVGGLDEAIAHIERHGSHHTDTIVTADEAAARRFLAEVDSASVMWNASTRLADGGVYGLGAEIGISTDRLHARGPMGPAELTTYKWVVVGDGHLRGGV